MDNIFNDEFLNKYNNVIIMGHKDIDLDAIGASLGIYSLINNENKYILIDDKEYELGVSKLLSKMESINIVRTEDIINKLDDNTLSIVVDTNRYNLVQSKEVLDKSKDIVVIDHHSISEDTIKTDYLLINENSSSASEMVALYYKDHNMMMDKYIGRGLLCGIYLDTNNFVLKTSADTFKAAEYISSCGVNTIDVQYILKQELSEFIERQYIITNTIVDNNIAITIADPNIKYRKEDLAKVADQLIMFNDIEASFVIGILKDDSYIGVSSRSIGNIDVSKIMEKLDGGGNKYEAATKLANTTMEDVKDRLIQILK